MINSAAGESFFLGRVSAIMASLMAGSGSARATSSWYCYVLCSVCLAAWPVAAAILDGAPLVTTRGRRP